MLVNYFLIAILEGPRRFEPRPHLEAKGQTRLAFIHRCNCCRFPPQKRRHKRSCTCAPWRRRTHSLTAWSVFTWRGLAFIQRSNCCRFAPQKRRHKRSLYVCTMEKAHALFNSLVCLYLERAGLYSMLQVPAAETAAQALAVRVHHGEGARTL
jgi:hypothetical protein